MKNHTPVRITLLLLLAFILCTAACARVTWLDDLDEAQKQAEQSNRQILAIFTSKNANMLCSYLAKEITDSPVFTKEAGQHFVLVNLDFPADMHPGSAAPEDPKEALLLQYGIYQFPTILLLDSSGRSYASCDYGGEESLEWLAQLTALKTQLQERDELLKNAVRETDIGKRLDAFVLAIDTFSLWGIIGNYPELKNEVIRLDENNHAGLKAKYNVERAIGDISATYLATNGMAAGLGALKGLLTEYPQGEAAQQIYYTMAIIESRLGRVDDALRLMQNAIAAAPTSAVVETIRATLRSLDFSPD